MKILKTINLVLLILLGFLSGIAKVVKLPQEMEFFHGEMGFAENTIVIFGLVQLAAGILLITSKSRLPGAVLLASTLIISSIVLFVAGKVPLGLFSILPILMTGFVIKEALPK